MKSGGPWNLRGLRPETRDAAREAARRSGLSVGEWLNGVIAEADDDLEPPMRHAEYDEDDWRDDYCDERPRGPTRRPKQRRREHEVETEAAHANEEFDQVHARLDRLTRTLEHMSRGAQLTGAPIQPQRERARPAPPPRNGARLHGSTSVDDAVAEIAERQRALYGEGAPAIPPVSPPVPDPARAPETAPQPSYAAPAAPQRQEPQVDISHLEEQLRYVTRRIETLRPNSELEKVVQAVREDLNDIRRQLTSAQPRNVVSSLENEVDALADRIDRSRGDGGVQPGALAGLEESLAEIRDALRHLTPAESLVGFDDAVRGLSQKLDHIIAREDPAALQQLETAIGALRGIVSHVASNDTLNQVADDVRALTAKVDALAIQAVSGESVQALEGRIDTLAAALSASAEAGHAVPRELEKLLAGLIEKLEWVQLTHTDHAALGQLEDRIAQLMKRLDASDARLGNLAAVERGLADLLVHLDEVGGTGAAPLAAARPVAVDAIERQVAEIKRSEQRTQDSLEAVHGAVEQVVDRLAMIESGLHETATEHEDIPQAPAAAEPPPDVISPALATLAALQAEPVAPPPPPPVTPPAAAATAPAASAAPPTAAPERNAAPRAPIDPHLPPDHPLEPGTASGPRHLPSAADRIAASEAAVGMSKPPVLSEAGGKTDFVAAARRAAQAAAAAPPERPARAEAISAPDAKKDKPSLMRKLIVAAAAVMIVVGGVHIALRMFQDRTTQGDTASPDPAEQTPPPAPRHDNSPQSDATPAHPGPLILPVPSTASDATPAPSKPPAPFGAPLSIGPEPAPVAKVPATTPAPAPTPVPARQSALSVSPDVTGALGPRAAVPPPPVEPVAPASTAIATSPDVPAPNIVEKLPATIGGPALRAAAMAGDAAAEFEVATRFTEGHGVPANNEAAARWLERAAKQGLPLAQFRLGGLYEKGIGVKKDLAMARDLYAAAAAKGNGKAMHNLAVLYAEGINGPADYHTASHWFRKAADRGITDSQYNLAILYARGIGVEQNYTEAYRWFALAAIAGDNEAAKKRDEVVTHLDEASLAIAKAAVQKWTAEPQPEEALSVKTPPGGWDAAEHATKPKAHAANVKPVTAVTKLN